MYKFNNAEFSGLILDRKRDNLNFIVKFKSKIPICPISMLLQSLFYEKKRRQAPTEGIEPSTYGLEVHRAIHCAMRAYIYSSNLSL